MSRQHSFFICIMPTKISLLLGNLLWGERDEDLIDGHWAMQRASSSLAYRIPPTFGLEAG